MKWDDTYDEEDEEGAGRVSFYDDFGRISGVWYRRIPSDLIYSEDRGERDLRYGLLHYSAMPYLFYPVSKDSKILSEETVSVDGQDMLFAVVNIPEGSNLFDVKVRKHLDSTRGLLIFVKNGFVYMLGKQLGIPLSDSKDLDEIGEPLLEGLKAFYQDIEFAPS